MGRPRESPPAHPTAAPACSPLPTYGTPRALLVDASAVVRSAPRLYAIYARRRLDPALREQIMVAVSRANACRPCTRFHERMAAGQDAAEAPVSPGPRGDQSVGHPAVAYATARAGAVDAPTDPHLEVALRKRFNADERRDIDAIIRLIRLASLSMNTLAVLRRRLSGKARDGAA